MSLLRRWYYGDAHRDQFLGPERASRISPLASADAHGVKWGLHSDAPITASNPLKTMWTVVTRKTRTAQTLGLEQCVTLEAALRAYTIDNAYLGFEEKEKGSLAVGKLCDLAILSMDPISDAIAAEPDKLLEIDVLGLLRPAQPACNPPATRLQPACNPPSTVCGGGCIHT